MAGACGATPLDRLRVDGEYLKERIVRDELGVEVELSTQPDSRGWQQLHRLQGQKLAIPIDSQLYAILLDKPEQRVLAFHALKQLEFRIPDPSLK